jgi:phospholipase C
MFKVENSPRLPGSWPRPAIPNTRIGPSTTPPGTSHKCSTSWCPIPKCLARLIINYDEADGSFDHILPPTPPYTSAYGASTVSIENEIVTTDTPNGPVGLGTRVPLLAISPWSKGGYVNSQVFDHTSVIQFIEKRFGVFESNISPWRRAVVGDLTSLFNFANPNSHSHVPLPDTDGFLPSVAELAGGGGTDFIPSLGSVIIGVPQQEPGVRPARALPYELNVHATVNSAHGRVGLKFVNSGGATVVFQVRSGNPADLVRTYTVESAKSLSDSWSVGSSYNLSVYGPIGFVRYFNGSIGSGAAALDVASRYDTDDRTSIELRITNLAASQAEVSVLDAYTGNVITRLLEPGGKLDDESSLAQFHGWYDLIITVAGDSTFKYRLAGHIENEKDSTSDPALGGLTLKG